MGSFSNPASHEGLVECSGLRGGEAEAVLCVIERRHGVVAAEKVGHGHREECEQLVARHRSPGGAPNALTDRRVRIERPSAGPVSARHVWPEGFVGPCRRRHPLFEVPRVLRGALALAHQNLDAVRREPLLEVAGGPLVARAVEQVPDEPPIVVQPSAAPEGQASVEHDEASQLGCPLWSARYGARRREADETDGRQRVRLASVGVGVDSRQVADGGARCHCRQPLGVAPAGQRDQRGRHGHDGDEDRGHDRPTPHVLAVLHTVEEPLAGPLDVVGRDGQGGRRPQRLHELGLSHGHGAPPIRTLSCSIPRWACLLTEPSVMSSNCAVSATLSSR